MNQRLITQKLNLAKELYQAGQIEEAYTALKKLEHTGNATSLGHLLLSQIYLRKNAIYHAEKYAVLAENDERLAADAIATLVEIFARKKLPVKARSELKRYREQKDSSKIMSNLLDARLEIIEESFESALVEVSEIVVADRNFTLARELFRQAYEEFSQYADQERFESFVDSVSLLIQRKSDEVIGTKKLGEPHLIDIIIPVFNGLEDLKQCLQSVERCHEALQGQIILVDDHSDVDTQRWLKEYTESNSNVRLIQNSQNLGFTRSVDRGIKASVAPYFLLLNSDTIVTRGWLSGLFAAIASDNKAAMAGPVSNNAFCQSILPPDFDWVLFESYGYSFEEIASFVDRHSRCEYPRLPYLSGFCLLIERKAFESVGGLNLELYPFGYWEVQDLAFRLLDNDKYGVLADNVYVHHRAGASSSNTRREELISNGLKTLARQYGSIRVLMAEEISRSNAVIKSLISKTHFYVGNITSHQEKAQVKSLPSRGRALRTWLVKRDANFSNYDVCIFAAYSQYGSLPKLTEQYLCKLKSSGFYVICVIATDNDDIAVDPSWFEVSHAVMIRENVGFDFGSWADALRDLPDIWNAERVFFANDSVVGASDNLDKIFKKILNLRYGFFAWTDCYMHRHHAQSYFFGWSRPNISSAFLKDFWDKLDYKSFKDEVIESYEINILSLSSQLPDKSCHIEYSIEDILGKNGKFLEEFSLTHQGWRALILNDFPLLKARLLLEGPCMIDDVSQHTNLSKNDLFLQAERMKIEGRK